MGNSESNWRSQLSFFCSLLLHAGAIALIALGPTMLENRFGNQGAKPQPVDMTIVTPPAAPAVKAPTVVMAKAPVVKPVVRPVKIHRAHKIARAVPPKPVIEKVARVAPVATPVKKVIAPAPVKTAVAAQPQPKAVAQPQQQQPAVPITARNAEPGKPSPSVAGTPNGVKTVTVTQNYLSLRQLPGNQPPAYSHDMRLKHEQGVGQLVYFVNRDGDVTNVHLTKSTGFPDLDQAAIQAFSKYRFVPGQEGYTVHNFEFVLNGPAMQDGYGLRTSMN